MAFFSYFSCLRVIGPLSLLWLSAPVAFGQSTPATPHGYDFLTVLIVESSSKAFAKIIITPAIQGKSEIQLVNAEPQYPSEKYTAAVIQNTTVINQTLSEVTTAGWELLQVCPLPPTSGTGINPTATRYLFRKAKN